MVLSLICTSEFSMQHLEVCAAKVHLSQNELCIIVIYRSPLGNLQYFLHKIEEISNICFTVTPHK
jgi:hypothetical protein